MQNPKIKILTHHNPNLISIFRRLGRLSKESVQVRGSVWFFVTNLFFMVKVYYPHAQPRIWRTTPYRLSVAAYSIYSQLPSIAGGRSSIRNPRTLHAVVTGTHLTWRNLVLCYWNVLLIISLDFRCSDFLHAMKYWARITTF
jgi:hypothetical protein